jgi:hypothetical protein
VEKMFGRLSNISYKPVNQLLIKPNDSISNNQTDAIQAKQLSKVPASLLKAITFGSENYEDYEARQEKQMKRFDLVNEGNFDGYYELIDKSNQQEIDEFIYYIKCFTNKKLGVSIAGVDPKITGVEFIKELYNHLALYKNLEMPLPNAIIVCDEDMGTNTLGTTYIKPSQENPKKIDKSVIYLNKHIFSDEYKQQHKDPAAEIFRCFYHEMGHHLHAKNLEHNNQLEKYMKPVEGLEVILNDDEKRTFRTFQDLYKKHYPEIQRKFTPCPDIDWLDTIDKNNYNMFLLEFNWNCFCNPVSVDRSYKIAEETQKAFDSKFIEELTPVMEKLINAVNLVKKELPERSNYKLSNIHELVAESTMTELEGKPLSPELREILYKLGKPHSQTMNYLDEHKKIA